MRNQSVEEAVEEEDKEVKKEVEAVGIKEEGE